MTENNFQEEENGTPEGEQSQEQENSQLGDDKSQDDNEKLTRYKQQIAGSKAENERLQELLVDKYKELATNDASVLDDLHKKDAKLTDKIAREFGYDDYNDLKKTMYSVSSNENKGLTESDLEDWYTKRRSKEIHSEALKEGEKIINNLPKDLQEKAKEYFTDIIDGKKLSIQQAKDFAEMSVFYVNKDKIKDEKYSTAMVDAMTTGVGKSKAQTDKVSKDTKDLADAMGFGKFFE